MQKISKKIKSLYEIFYVCIYQYIANIGSNQLIDSVYIYIDSSSSCCFMYNISAIFLLYICIFPFKYSYSY